MADTFMFDDEAMEEIESAKPLGIAPKGEYTIECTSIMMDKNNGNLIRENKDGNPYFLMVLEIVDAQDYKDFTHYVPLPSPKLGKRNKNTATEFRELHQAFGVQIKKEFDPRKFIGQQAEALLDVEIDAQYGDKNKIVSLSIPK